MLSACQQLKQCPLCKGAGKQLVKEVREKQAREEDDEVVDLLEVGGSTLLEDTTTTSPAELDQVLVAFYQNDRVLDKEGRPVTFTELLMG